MRHPVVMRALLRAHAKLAPPRSVGTAPCGPPPLSTGPGADPRGIDAAGWDPYEVWRTRVLLAREGRAARLLAGAAELPLGEIDQDEDFDPEPGANRLASRSFVDRR